MIRDSQSRLLRQPAYGCAASHSLRLIFEIWGCRLKRKRRFHATFGQIYTMLFACLSAHKMCLKAAWLRVLRQLRATAAVRPNTYSLARLATDITPRRSFGDTNNTTGYWIPLKWESFSQTNNVEFEITERWGIKFTMARECNKKYQMQYRMYTASAISSLNVIPT